MINLLTYARKIKLHSHIYSNENLVCWIHYRLTVSLIIACTALCTLYQLVGDPITCVTPTGKVPRSILEIYCWVQGTFTVPKYSRSIVKQEVPYEGIGPYSSDEEAIHHSYYMWVPFVLLLEGAIFYFPHILWKYLDDKKFSQSAHFDNLLNRMKIEKNLELLSVYIRTHLYCHNSWYSKYVFCEGLHFIALVTNSFLLIVLLGKEFFTYGPEVFVHLKKYPESTIDPMSMLFPKVTKCTFQTFGPSGTVQILDSMCVLAVNIINEKIFLFLWLWFVFLLIINVALIVYRTIYTLSPSFRERLLALRLNAIDPAERQIFKTVVLNQFSIGDWFLFQNLLRCMDLDAIKIFILKLVKQFQTRRPSSTDNVVIEVEG